MSASHMRKSLLSLNSWNYGGGSPAIPPPPTSCSKERSNSNASCRTTASSSALALATSNMVDFWNRVSQQMAYIDGSTRSPSLIGDGGSCGTRSSLPNDFSGNGTKDAILAAAAPGNNQSLSLLDDDRILGSTMASINSRSVSLLDGAAESIPEEEDDIQDEEDASPPLLPLPPAPEVPPALKVLPQKVTSPASLSGSGRYTATTCSPETAALTHASPPQRKPSKLLQRQANVNSSEDVSGDDVPEQPFDMVFYYHAGVGTKKASSWEESEAVQRRRSVMLAAAVVGTGTGPGYPITTSCPGTAGLLMLHPTSSELQLLDKRDLRYYFQHPYPRLFVTYFVIFCNFLLFAEDPISHSHTESDIPMVGNVFSFVLTKYPPEWRWSLIKVLMWLLAMLIGMILGKLLIHGYVCGKLLRLKMFRDDQGSWMTMFLTVIVSLYVFSHAYNLLLVLWYDDSHYQINSQMGVTNASVMKAAACGTWLGDLITALMVTDMMLQDNLYPHWASWFRQLWRRSNVPRILIFWVGSVVATSVVVTLIVSDWISWDKLNRDFVATTELSRAFLASFILVMDLLIVMQDWDFPHFTTTLHVNLPGFSVATLNWKYAEVDITGKWFNYGIIVMVMLLDLNMWKNQIFYNPKDFGQYTGPDDKIRTVNDPEILATGNISYWTWESRARINPETNLPYYEEDMQMNSRFMYYPLSVKWTAFIPSVIGLVLFVSLVSLYGRFPAHQPHGVKRNQSPCRGAQGKQEGNSR